MKYICASIIAVQLLLGGIPSCSESEILKMGSITIPKHFSERVIDIVVNTPVELIIDHLNDISLSR